jgi:puromycin-sensitive aminopeptidase
MENAGAIFFRDRDLLIDPKSGSVQNQKLVAIVVAHEMAHQWFGDLVTMKWWDDTWLNEAFASLMENESIAALHPDWHIWDLFRSDNEHAFHPDSLKTTHPIHADVATAEEANDAFDDITYIKGQACLRMLELYLSPKTWQTGIHDYLVAHAGANAAEADLWQALATASKQPVADIAKSWFEQPGFPLVTVKRAGKGLQISQQRFFLNPKDAGKTKALWEIPLCVKSAGGEQSCQLVTGKTGKADLGGKPAWFDANAEASGFYRVRYAAGDLRALDAPMREAAAQTGLSVPEKIALVEDSWALARSGTEKLAPELQLLADLAAERDASLAGDVEANISYLDRNLLDEKDRAAFSGYVEAIFGPTLAELKWDPAAGEGPDHHELRSVVLRALGLDARDPAVIADAAKRLDGWEKDPNSLDPSLVGAVLTIAARHGDAKRWDDLKARMDASTNPEDHDHFMYALAEFQDPALIQKSLDLSISGGIRKQDVAHFLGQLLQNREASAAGWTFVKAHFADVLAHSTPQSIDWSVIPAMGMRCSADDHRDLADFFASHKIESSARPLAEALEGIDLCVRFKQQHKAELGKWLKTFRPADKATASR